MRYPELALISITANTGRLKIKDFQTNTSKNVRYFLNDNAPDVLWRSIKGLRDHIAHCYFNLDSEIIFDVARNEVPGLRTTF